MTAGDPASFGFTGKIVYPPCRTAVAPPSDWTPKLAERSARLPEVNFLSTFPRKRPCFSFVLFKLFFYH